jgi:hypothetical protein
MGNVLQVLAATIAIMIMDTTIFFDWMLRLDTIGKRDRMKLRSTVFSVGSMVESNVIHWFAEYDYAVPITQ